MHYVKEETSQVFYKHQTPTISKAITVNFINRTYSSFRISCNCHALEMVLPGIHLKIDVAPQALYKTLVVLALLLCKYINFYLHRIDYSKNTLFSETQRIDGHTDAAAQQDANPAEQLQYKLRKLNQELQSRPEHSR